MKVRVKLRDKNSRTNEEVIEDITDIFNSYGISISRFFVREDENDETDRQPLLKNGKINAEVLRTAEYLLGLEENTLSDPDHHNVLKWFDKYKYFQYLTEFRSKMEESKFNDEGTLRTAGLIKFLFGPNDLSKYGNRYNYDNVLRRMIDVLKEMDHYLPGTYHDGAEIYNWTVRTDHLVHYKNFKDFVNSYFELIDSYKALFFKGLNTDLTDEEIKEYNFLVSVLCIKDKYCPHILSTDGLYYADYQVCKDIYRAINSDDIFEYIRIKKSLMPEFWKCAELSEHREIAQKLVDYYPSIKFELKKLAILISNFCCDFIWSDTDLHGCSLNLLYSDADPLDDTGEFFTRIYVEKTPDELRDDYKYAGALLKLSGPEKQGGLSINTRNDNYDNVIMLDRIQKMIDARSQFLEALHDKH